MLPDGNAVLGDKAGSLVEWSPTGKQPPVRWKGHTQEVSSVSCTARGILSSSADFNMAIWPRAGAEPTRIFAEAEIVTARWNPKSADEILIAPFDPSARVWSLSQGRAVRVLSGHTGPLTDAAYDPSGLLLTASMDGTVRLWDPANGASVGALRRGSSWPIAVVSGPFGVLSAGRDGTLTWWDTTPEVEPVDSVDRIVSCRVPYRIQGESLVVSKLDCGK
jgi:WD40 repeat protein